MSTPRAIAKRLRRQAKPALRLYCQVCERQFRDKRALDAHNHSAEHSERLVALAGSEAACQTLFSERFLNQFLLALAQLSQQSHFADHRVQALQVYAYMTRDPKHVRLHATCWRSLRHFLRWLLVKRASQVILVSSACAEKDTDDDGSLQPERVWLALPSNDTEVSSPNRNLRLVSNTSILAVQERKLELDGRCSLPENAPSAGNTAQASSIPAVARNVEEVERLVHELTPWNPCLLRGKRFAEECVSTPAPSPGHPSWIPRFQAGDLVRIRNETLFQGQLQGRQGVVLRQAPLMDGCVLDVQVSMQPDRNVMYVLRLDQNELELVNE
jgi:hypothetical protein